MDNDDIIKVCSWAMKKIKAILEDDSLEDCECFLRIEEIVKLLEAIGVDNAEDSNSQT